MSTPQQSTVMLHSRLFGTRRPKPAERWFRPRLEELESRRLLAIDAAVVGRFVFYDNSFYDGNAPGISASDSSAIAPDKSALLSGAGPGTFANLTSYNRGINGLFVDLTGSHPGITASDFTFRVGNNNAPTSWAAAAAPVGVTVRAGAGVSGSDRVEIVWADGAIRNEWLEVIVSANGNTGLPTSDAFFFGNATGDSGAGDSASTAPVNTTDELSARNNPKGLG